MRQSITSRLPSLINCEVMIHVLFVCLGNICRSPMAEAVFLHLVEKVGLQNQIEVDSAGTGDWFVGAPAHKETRAILRENQIEFTGCGRQIAVSDFDNFDYIITMDNENLANVRALEKQSQNAKAHIAPLLEYSAPAKANGIIEVPDPYLVGGFDVVYRLVDSGCRGLLAAIRNEHEL